MQLRDLRLGLPSYKPKHVENPYRNYTGDVGCSARLSQYGMAGVELRVTSVSL